MQQLITPNPNIPCKPGWCLQYVRQTFGLAGVYPSATAGWAASPTKHRNQNFPPGVWLPLWFFMEDEPLGHVVLRAPDGSIYSTTDLSNTPRHHPSLGDLMRVYAGAGLPLTYLGWTEDIENVAVVDGSSLAYSGTTTPTTSEEDDLMATPEQRQELIKDLLDHHVDQAGGGVTSLRALLSEARPHQADIIRVVEGIPEATLNAHIPRGGGQPGETSLAAVASWHDAHIVAVIDSVSKATGADVGTIKKAVLEGLAEGVTVKVTVEGKEAA